MPPVVSLVVEEMCYGEAGWVLVLFSGHHAVNNITLEFFLGEVPRPAADACVNAGPLPLQHLEAVIEHGIESGNRDRRAICRARGVALRVARASWSSAKNGCSRRTISSWSA